MKYFIFLIFFSIFIFEIFSNENSFEKSKKDQIIISDKITALIFSSSTKLIKNKDLENYQGIEVHELKIKNLKKFKKYFNHFIGKPLTFENLENIKAQTLYYFKNETNFFVDVKILENQDVSFGKIQIYVQIAKIGNVYASNSKYFSDTKVIRDFEYSNYKYIELKKIRKYTAFLNKNPFREVSTILKPGKDIGFTDVYFYTKDLFPIKIYGGYENTGNVIAGQSRFLLGLNFGNLLNLDHQANIEFKTSPMIKEWWGISGNYIIPSFYYTYLKIIGAYVKTKPNVNDYCLKGNALIILLRYIYPFEINKLLTNEIIVGYDFKRTNNYLYFHNYTFCDNYMDISQFILQFNGKVYYKYGLISYLLSFYISPGGMTKHNKNFEFFDCTAATKYIYGTFHFDMVFNLPRNFLYVIDFFGQLSSSRLISTEQISLGGYSTIRGYQENKIYADEGFYLKNEIRAQKIHFRKISLKNDLQFLVFIDFGYASRISKNLYRKNSCILASVGPGLRYTANDICIIKLDCGIQLKNIDRKCFNKSWNARTHFFISL